MLLASMFPLLRDLGNLIRWTTMNGYNRLAYISESIGWPVLGLVAVLMLRREDRGVGARRHLCAACGYDLTGNVSGVCPECGTGVRIEHAVGAGKAER